MIICHLPVSNDGTQMGCLRMMAQWPRWTPVDVQLQVVAAAATVRYLFSQCGQLCVAFIWICLLDAPDRRMDEDRDML